MRSCWIESPTDRPNFADLRDSLAKLTDASDLRYSTMPTSGLSMKEPREEEPRYMNEHMDTRGDPRLSAGAYLNRGMQAEEEGRPK